MEVLFALLVLTIVFAIRYAFVLCAGSTLIDPWAMPGMGTPAESTERRFLAGQADSWFIKGVVLVSTTVDARSTVTSDLQEGLVLGRITASGKFRESLATSTDGSQVARGLLFQSLSMLDGTGTAADKQARIVIFAVDVKAAQCATMSALVKRQLAGRIWFDDDFWENNNLVTQQVIAKTADYTVLASENNTLFTTKGAVGTVIFTLPTLARGLRYRFYNEAGQTMTITSAAVDTLVTFNDLAADSVSFQTANELIGGCVEVVANSDASKWLVIVSAEETQTLTVAT